MIFVRPIFSTLLTDDNYKIDGERTASQLLGCLDRDWVYRRWNTGGEAVRAWYTKSEVFADGDEEDVDYSYSWTPKPRPDHPWVADVLSRKPNFHPTIMMRLCTQSCYAGLSETPFLDFCDGWNNSLCWRHGPRYSTSSV